MVGFNPEPIRRIILGIFMHNFKHLAVVVTLLLLSACKSTPSQYSVFFYDRIDNLATLPLSQKIPLPGEYIEGKYENGLHYYIRQNSQPSGRVEIRLVLRAGSLLENDNQQGFAHFVEHMAFNGTADFSQRDITDFVESTGMSVGSHLNAFTSFDNTFYVLELPSNDSQVLETGIRIIENWAHKVNFASSDIQKERGVVLEEWRAGKNVNERMSFKHLQKSIPDSRWIERFPIGQPDIIQNGEEADLIAYYKKWYRPDLMSVVVIGDIDTAQVATLLDKYLGAIPARADKIDADTLYAQFTVANNTAPIVSIETDEELTTGHISILTVHPKMPLVTFADLREQYLVGLHTTMLNFRLHEKVVTEDFPSLSATVDFGPYFGDKDMYSFFAGTKTGKVREAIRAILTEAYRVEQTGFTETELIRAKQSWRADLRQQAQTMLSDISSNHANRLLGYIINAYPMLDADDALLFSERILPTISLSEVNAIGQTWLTSANRVVQISALDSEKSTLPSEQEVIDIWDDVAGSIFSAFVDQEVPDTLMTDIPDSGSVVNKKHYSDEDYHIWTLSNGVRVILKETSLVTGQINFRAFSEGGNSVLNDTQFNRTRMTAQIMDSMGVADFDYITMTKFLADKAVYIESSIDNYSEWMSGDFTTQDTSTFMQLLHLKFTQTRADEANFTNYINYVRPQVLNQFNSPQAKFSEAIRSAIYKDDVRNLPFDTDMLNQQSLPDMVRFYQQRYSNAADFTFVFIGDFYVDQFEPFLSTYIATLPASSDRETFMHIPDVRTPGEVIVRVNENTEPRAEVYIGYRGNTEYSHQNELVFGAFINALDIKLRQKIREEKSAAYSVNVDGTLVQTPRGEFGLNISFTSDPNRVDEIIADINAVLNTMQTELVDTRFVDNFIAQQKEQFAFDIKTNAYWGYYLLRLHTLQTPFTHAQYDADLNAVTANKIRDIAKQYLATPHRIEAIMMPKN